MYFSGAFFFFFFLVLQHVFATTIFNFCFATVFNFKIEFFGPQALPKRSYKIVRVRPSVIHLSQELLDWFSWYFAWRFFAIIRKKRKSDYIQKYYLMDQNLVKWGKFAPKTAFLCIFRILLNILCGIFVWFGYLMTFCKWQCNVD